MTPADAYDDGLGAVAMQNGPWSHADAPEGTEFLDFGPLLLPSFPGLKARLEIDPQRKQVGAVTVRIADCALQLQVITKRRGVSLWTDTRQELLANLRRRAGHQQVVEGRFGAEVIAVITGRTTAGGLIDATMRFQGLEGDTWMIRAVSSGPSVTHDDVVARMDAFLSGCAVRVDESDLEPGTVLPLSELPGRVDEAARARIFGTDEQ